MRAIVGVGGKARRPLPGASLQPGAHLILEGSDKALDHLFTRTPLEQTRDPRELEKDEAKEELRIIEAVVQTDSLLIGRGAENARLQDMHGVQLMGIGRSDERITQRLRHVRLRAGDVLVLRAGDKTLPEALGDLGACCRWSNEWGSRATAATCLCPSPFWLHRWSSWRSSWYRLPERFS
ncbi:MAG: TrkA C-terminal domain-containing protein [Sphingomonadales bacterium]|nr:TrkA C-terminal domain-containing protein [Sphingomonadales bacterium]MDE2171667.1 TrkA C-terminal domain-containing protein [Sphingomonadales bacterium]